MAFLFIHPQGVQDSISTVLSAPLQSYKLDWKELAQVSFLAK